MSQRSSGPSGAGSDEWPDDEPWPDDAWPDDDDRASGDRWPAQSMPPGSAGRGSSRRWPSPATLAVVAVIAVVAGAGIALGVQSFSGGSPAASAPSGQSFGPAPPQPGGGGQAAPNGAIPGGGSAGAEQVFMVGTVIKLSAASITIGGPGHTITADLTRSTRVSGKVSAISGLKAGDQVSAEISESDGRATVVALQYPAQPPSGGVPGG